MSVGSDDHCRWLPGALDQGAYIIGGDQRQVGGQDQNRAGCVHLCNHSGTLQGCIQFRLAVFTNGTRAIIARNRQSLWIAAGIRG